MFFAGAAPAFGSMGGAPGGGAPGGGAPGGAPGGGPPGMPGFAAPTPLIIIVPLNFDAAAFGFSGD
jgi:hypothetical protein